MDFPREENGNAVGALPETSSANGVEYIYAAPDGLFKFSYR